MLSTITLIGRPTRDPELMQTKVGTRYTKLDIAVNKGYDTNEHVNFYSCWFKEEAADRILKAGVKKGSLIYLTGDLDVKTYTKTNGTQGQSLNVNVSDWGYVSSGKAKTDANAPTQPQPNAAQYNPHASTPAPNAPQFETIEDDDLPF